jgi:WD40 repeat protein
MIARPRAFVTFSALDELFGLRFVQDLINGGIDVWSNDVPLIDGRLPPHVMETMGSCHCFIAVQTPEAFASDRVRAALELALAHAGHDPHFALFAFSVVPIDPSEQPPGWERLRVIDAITQVYPVALTAMEQLMHMSAMVPASGAPTWQDEPLAWHSLSSAITQGDIPARPWQTPSSGPLARPAPSRISRRGFVTGAGVALVGAAIAGGAILAEHLAHPHVRVSRSVPLPTPAPGEIITSFTGQQDKIYGVAWSPDGKRIASGSAGDNDQDYSVRIWEAFTGHYAASFTKHTNTVREVAYAHNGALIASVSDDGTAQIWNPATLAVVINYQNHAGGVEGVAWSPKDERIATASADATAQIWDPLTGKLLTTYYGHGARVNGVAWSPDGARVISCGFDGTAQIWDASSGKQLLVYAKHTAQVFRVRWSADGKFVVTSSADRMVRVWDPNTGDDTVEYTGHTGAVYPVAISPDSNWIASGGEDQTTQIWDAHTGVLNRTFRGQSGWIDALDWSADGHTIVSGADDHSADVWRAR